MDVCGRLQVADARGREESVGEHSVYLSDGREQMRGNISSQEVIMLPRGKVI